MSNLMGPFNICLSQHGIYISTSSTRQVPANDEFLKEAYRIYEHILSLRRYLISIRRAYHSTDPPSKRPQRPSQHVSSSSHSEPIYLSKQDKDSVDASSKSVLRDLAASLTQLASAESVRRETSAHLLNKKYNKGFLSKWAAGETPTGKDTDKIAEEEALNTIKLVRDGVIWFLQKRLEDVSEIQRRMMERRLEREVEKSRSMLHKVRRKGGNMPADGSSFNTDSSNGVLHGTNAQTSADGPQGQKFDVSSEDDRRHDIEQQLDPDQLQLFAKENKDMLKHYEDTLNQVRTAERSMSEISELQTQLVQNLDIQSSNISQLVADSLSTTENVGSGNKQLKKASERSSKARMLFWASIGLTGFLVTWDLIF